MPVVFFHQMKGLRDDPGSLRLSLARDGRRRRLDRPRFGLLCRSPKSFSLSWSRSLSSFCRCWSKARRSGENRRERRQRRVAFSDIPGIDNENEHDGKARGLHRGPPDAMWFPHLSPLKCRKQRKTQETRTHSRKPEDPGWYLFVSSCP